MEVLTEIAKSCDVYLMETILDDESGVCSNLTFSLYLKKIISFGFLKYQGVLLILPKQEQLLHGYYKVCGI